MNHFFRQLIALIILLSLAMSIAGCSHNAPVTRDVTISKLFKICATVPDDAQLARDTPVDTEFITYKDSRSSYKIDLTHYSGSMPHMSGPPVSIGGPLNIVVLGTQPNANSRSYVVQFDSIGAVLPQAYGSVQILGDAQREPDALFSFLAGWRRCKQT
ncbi:hypothetical protein [Luteimonas mephitis]|uniref:hypothetical protein n=1 Tax=Luteimonas mephitis TaxID=83615 RepID=UPI0012EBE0E5|nr:hypothetical protein [Luteimonas mephitis]